VVSRVAGPPDLAKPPVPVPGLSGAGGTAPPGPGSHERLGKRGTDLTPPGAPTEAKPGLTTGNTPDEKAEERRKERWANRRLLWTLSGEKSVQCCNRGVVDQGAGVTIKANSERAYVSGVTRCSAIWLCPVCSARIRAERSEEISKAVVQHIQAGGTAYMATLTVRHHKRHELADLLDALRDAFGALTSGAPWAGDRARGREGERSRLGILGFIRATETTVGPDRHGWHPHVHVILLMGARQTPRPPVPRKANRPDDWVMPDWDPRPTGYFPVPDPEWDRSAMSDQERQTAADFERLQERWRRCWESWTEKRGFRANQQRGVKFDRIKNVRDAQALGEYLAKTQEGEKDVAMEVARGDLKGARIPGNLTPFELLSKYRQLRNMTADEIDGAAKAGIDVAKKLNRIKRLWREYETATKGRRAIEWSRYLRDALELEEERSDEEIVEDDGQGETAAHITADGWGRVCRLQMDYRALRAMENGGVGELAALLGELGVEVESAAERRRMERARYGRVVPPQGRRVPESGSE
jgi:hypothetical protein